MIAKINWNPSSGDLRKFGWSILIGFGLIGGLIFWKASASVAFIIWGGALLVGLLALAAPPASKPFYWVWMGIALIMGTVISTIILLIIFFFIFTPVGLVMRMVGRDPLHLKKASYKSDTYWFEHDDISSKEYYERLF